MSAGRIGLALAGSLLLHLAAAAALIPWLAPGPVPQQAVDASRVMLATMPVPRGRAEAQRPDAASALESPSAGARMAGQGVPLRRAQELTPRANSAEAGQAAGTTLRVVSEPAPPVKALAPETDRFLAVAPVTTRSGAVPPARVTVAAGTIAAAALPGVPPPQTRAEVAVPMPIQTRAGDTGGAVLVARIASGSTVAPETLATASIRAEPGPPPVTALTPTAPVTGAAQAGSVPLAARVPAAAQAQRLESRGAPVSAGRERAGGVTLAAQSLAGMEASLEPGQAARIAGQAGAVTVAASRVAAGRIQAAERPAVPPPENRAGVAVPELIQTRARDTSGATLDARIVDGSAVAPETPAMASIRAAPGPPPVTARTPTAPVTGAAQAASVQLAARLPEAAQAARLESGGALVTAGMEWSGAGGIALDAQSLATLQAFLQPGQAAGQDVRDRMAGAMAAPDCARVHTVFDPETGTLELRGHVPEPAARAPLVAALQAQIGAALPLRDALRILPRPQCALLDGIAALGLPQSEEQLTDSDLVGENAQVREYAFDEGDRLTIDLTAPDYPAWVYVDYFDSSGQVLHLMPNDRMPLRLLAPNEIFSIGRSDDLDLRIAPPFGQDIAVAFASSRPLYEEARPLVEPAAPYLAEMRARIAAVQAADPGFRGEWVYLFVATGPSVR